MKPMDAIKTATKTAAELMGVETALGTIKPNKKADIIAVTKNPLNDISTLKEVSFVMKNGVVYKLKGKRVF